MARVARTILFALVAGVFASTTALHAQTPENSWTAYASDPGGYRLGWGSAHWISGLRGMLVWGGHSHNYRGNNSVRLFDPRTNAWQFLWPDGWSNGGLQNRDNHASFYVPGRGSQGEFWVIGGNYTTAIGDPVASGNHFAGRFDLVTRTWFVAHSPQEFAAGLIAPPFAPTSNPAHAWCDQLNSGVLFGGSAEGNAVNVTALIEPNPGGPTPYRYWAGVLPGSPPPRAQVRAQGVCVGRTFYVYGGFAQETRTGQLVNVYRNDLWRLDVPTRTWSQLGSGGQGGVRLVMTYDAHAHVLVVHGGENRRDLHAYDIARDSWRDMTPTMRRVGNVPWRRSNHVGVYAPTVDRHLYTGGNTWNEDGSEAYYDPSALTVAGYRYGPAPDDRPVAAPSGGRRNLPVRTWIARPLPARGQGPCPTGCKHMRLAHNPLDGRVYFLGGDYSGPGGIDSGRDELYSYSVGGGDWRLDYPYCGSAEEVQPAGPDEVGWVFDARRNRFWMTPGFVFGWQGRMGCPGAATKVSDMMAFDPQSRTWAKIGTLGRQRGLFAQYDPITDSIISFRFDGGYGSVVDLYHVDRDRWETVGLRTDTAGRFVGDARLTNEYAAIDVAGRAVYVISPLEGRLLRYNIDARSITWVADTPVRMAGLDFTVLVWDSVSRVLLWPHIPNLDGQPVTLYVYHPQTKMWERDPMHQPAGYAVRGNSAVFDPSQNVLLLIGGLRESDLDPSLRHFFLYRYGSGPPEPGRGVSGRLSP